MSWVMYKGIQEQNENNIKKQTIKKAYKTFASHFENASSEIVFFLAFFFSSFSLLFVLF